MCHDITHTEQVSNITMKGLLYNGTLYDQPAKLMYAFDVIKNTYDEMYALKRMKRGSNAR